MDARGVPFLWAGVPSRGMVPGNGALTTECGSRCLLGQPRERGVLRCATALRVTGRCAPWDADRVGTGNVSESSATPAARVEQGTDDLDKPHHRHDLKIVGVGSNADTQRPVRCCREVDMNPPMQTAAAIAEVDVWASA